MAVVGGAQSLLGPILGAALLSFLNDVLPAAQSQGMVYGAALVATLILAPQGLAGLAQLLIRLRNRDRQPVTGSRTAFRADARLLP